MTLQEHLQAFGEWWQRTRSFLRRGLWEDESPAPVKPGIRAFLRFIVLVFREFNRDDCLMRASALTYISLLAIVPILAIMFAASRGFGLDNTDQLIQKLISLGPAAESSAGESAGTVIRNGFSESIQEAAGFIQERVQNIDFKALGVFGVLGSLLTAFLAIGSAEEAFNRIWGVSHGRSIWRRFSDYLSVLMLGPLLIYFSLQQSREVVGRVVKNEFFNVEIPASITNISQPILALIAASLAFTFVYIFLPNTRVKLRYALAGGFLGGTLWQFSQWVYVKFQVGVANYSALYGTLSALPIFLVWIYLSWLILLFCAEATFCLENYKRLSREFLDVNLSMRDRESIALWMTARVAESYYRNSPRWNVKRFSDALRLRDSVTMEVLRPLLQKEILLVLADSEQSIVPGRDPSTIRLSEILDAIAKFGDQIPPGGDDSLLLSAIDHRKRMKYLGENQADTTVTEFLRRTFSGGDARDQREPE
ncbi:MAG TPA: YihY/virulence factor BrkB family protein [bacterium]|nr:YihY/virulence factor BrkB family protein [bacterium]HQL62676.1 YihY/virulence factor BrkB family protein [bacterium]